MVWPRYDWWSKSIAVIATARDSTAFVVAQPESDHMSGAITGVARGQASQSPCIQRVPDPVCGHDDRDTDPGLFGG